MADSISLIKDERSECMKDAENSISPPSSAG
jgi:hypothetical protein